MYKTQRDTLISRVQAYAKEMIPTGTMHFFGEGNDEDWLVLLDPWGTDVESVLSIMDDYAELGGSMNAGAEPDSVGDGWRSYKTDKLSAVGVGNGEPRALNFILCVDSEFYQKMKRATEHVKKLVDTDPQAAKVYRQKEARVNTFRSIVGR